MNEAIFGDGFFLFIFEHFSLGIDILIYIFYIKLQILVEVIYNLSFIFDRKI